ncbi:MAG: zinc ribbon domain-containing protein [Acidaminococcales bacterium]|nr:zinc ribbon domain-containing protein [Acidaminococcales bacterium]
MDTETWELAQKLRRVVRRPMEEHAPNPLTGLLICADCGGRLHNRRSDYTTDRNGKRIWPVDTYECENYRKNAAKFVDVCSIHFIRTSVVRELILKTIRRVTEYAKINESEFVAKLRADSEVQQADAAKSHRKLLARNERRIAELDTLFIKIYEDA